MQIAKRSGPRELIKTELSTYRKLLQCQCYLHIASVKLWSSIRNYLGNQSKISANLTISQPSFTGNKKKQSPLRRFVFKVNDIYRK